MLIESRKKKSIEIKKWSMVGQKKVEGGEHPTDQQNLEVQHKITEVKIKMSPTEISGGLFLQY